MKKQPGVWDDEKPTEEGYYWFYGYFGAIAKEPALYLLHGYRAVYNSTHVYFSLDGRLLDHMPIVGKWLPVLKPSLPDRANK